jgi:CHASE2 domain-containing sensor protein
MLQAQQISQIIIAALGERSLTWTASLWQETLWLLLWSTLAGLMTSWVRLRFLGLGSIGAIAILYGICWFGFAQGSGWISLVPAAIAFIVTLFTVRLLKS